MWRTSSRSSGGSCVEVAPRPDRILVRDTKNREAGMLAFDRSAFAAFIDGVVRGEFDLHA